MTTSHDLDPLDGTLPPPPAAPLTAPMPGWNTPSQWPPQTPPPPRPTVTGVPLADESGGQLDDGDASPYVNTEGSSQGSIDVRPEALAARRKRVTIARKVAGTLFEAGGGLLNRQFRIDEHDNTWCPDEEEVRGVADPLGRIAGRHLPVPAGADAGTLSDLGDAIEALAGLAAYAINHLGRRAEYLREYGPPAPRVVQQQDEPASEPAPAPAPPVVGPDAPAGLYIPPASAVEMLGGGGYPM